MRASVSQLSVRSLPRNSRVAAPLGRSVHHFATQRRDRMPDTHLWIPEHRARFEPVVKGGGGDSYTREDIAQHSKALRAAFEKSADRLSEKRDYDLATDVIVQITTAPDRSIGKERQHLRALGFEVVSLSESQPNVATARIRVSELSKFSKKLNRYAESTKHIGKGNFSAIESIEPVGFERKLEPALASTEQGHSIPCLISFVTALPEETKELVAARLTSDLRDRQKQEVDVHRFVNGTVAVSAELTVLEMREISEQYMLVRSIESDAEVMIESATPADDVPAVIQIDRPRINSPVVILDSGVNSACALLDGIVVQVVNELPAGSVGPHLDHGTLVGSRIVYGDDITRVLSRRASPWCPLIDVQVTGDDGLGNRVRQRGSRLAEILQRTVPKLAPTARVFNLSLGFSPIADGRYSALARLIDFLSREHQVLFVISAGNIDEPNAEPPAHYLSPDTRVLVPSESLLALTVGSVARFDDAASISRVGEVSPFSRRGPGADRALKPELVAHGGNVIWHGSGWATSPRLAAFGLDRSGTRLCYAIGTSFAAPIISQFAARLFDAYPAATPNLVRALLCHFAKPVACSSPGAPIRDYDFCGFGEPDIESALYSGANRAAYLFSGSLPKDYYIYIPFHVPSALANSARSRLRVRGTVVFDPPVSPDDSVDYSLCRIAGKLRKRQGNELREVDIGGDEDDTLYPWNPLLQFSHRFRRGYASGEWELRLRLLTRGDLPDNFLQKFSVVIELIDEAGEVDVRSSIPTETKAYVAAVLRLAA